MEYGDGTLILSGANTYSGGTTLSSATLVVAISSDSTPTNGPLGTGTLYVNGGTLYASGAQTVANAVQLNGGFNTGGAQADVLTLSGPTTLTGNCTINVNMAGSTVFSGIIHDGGSGYGLTLNSTGTGTLTLSGANTYSGGTTLSNGILAAGIDSASVNGVLVNGAFGTGPLTINGGTLMSDTAAHTVGNTITVHGNFTIGGTNNLTLSGPVDLSGTPSIITVSNTGDTTLSGVISNGGITKDGPGKLILSGANTYSIPTTLMNGTLVAGIDSTGSPGNPTSGAFGINYITLSGGTLQSTGNHLVYNNVMQNAASSIGGSWGDNLTIGGFWQTGNNTLTVNNAGNTTLAGKVYGNGNIIQNGTGILTLSMNNGVNYAGTVILNCGTLVTGNFMAFGTGWLNVNGGTLYASGAQTLVNPLTLTGDFSTGGPLATDVLTLSSATILTGNRTININGAGSTVLSGAISDGGSGYGLTLNSTGTGSLTLSGANSYTGNTTLTAGTLVLNHNSALGNGGTLNIATGTTLQAGTSAPTITNAVSFADGTTLTFSGGNNLALTGSGTSNVTLGGATGATISVDGSGVLSLGGGAADVIHSCTNGTFTKAGTGTLLVAGDNSATMLADTALTAGTLLVGNANALGAASASTTLAVSGGRLAGGTTAATTTLGVSALTVTGSFALGNLNDATANLTYATTFTLGDYFLTHSGISSDTLGNVTGGTVSVTAGTLTLSGTGTSSAGTNTIGGTLNLSGTLATYSGASTITSGTVNMSGTNATYCGANYISGGTVNMSGREATYSGPGTLSGGTLNLSAGNYTGTLTVSTGGVFHHTGGIFNPAGGLTNNGAAHIGGTLTGDLTNNAGGIVGGTGTISGALTNSGTVDPGNSPGTLTVGTYTSNPGATQVMEMASAPNYDKIITTAAGGATLNGGTISPQLLNGYFPSTNTVFHVIQTTGGGTVAGAFDGIDNTRVGASRTLFWQARYTPTTADLQAVANYTPPGMALAANQRSVGSALNSLAPTATGGDLLTVLDAINALTTNAGVAAAYTEISPAKYAALSSLNFPITHMQFQYLQNRLARVRWEAALDREAFSPGRGFGRGFNFSYDSNTRTMLAASNLTISDAGNRYTNNGVAQRWGIYLEPSATWGSLNATANLAGYRYKNFGFTLGAEYWLLDNLLVGLNTGYSRTLGSTGGSGGDLNANVIPVNAYGAYFHRGFYANVALGYTYSGYDLQRNIAFGAVNRTAQASTSGNQFQVGAETGYDAAIGHAVVGPVLSLQYATQTVAGFTESNAGALALNVASQTADSVQSGLGVRASYNARLGNVAVKPHLSVTWQHEFSNNTRGLNATLAAGGSTINFQTDKIGQDFALISLDLPAKITRNLVANLGYTAEVGRNQSSNMGANIGLKLKW